MRRVLFSQLKKPLTVFWYERRVAVAMSVIDLKKVLISCSPMLATFEVGLKEFWNFLKIGR